METITGSRQDLSKKAAELIQKHSKEIAKTQDQVNLAIPGGTSVTEVFNHLKTLDIPWEKVHIFMVDERNVPVTSVQSNFKQALDVFIKDVFESKKIAMQNIHPIIPEHGMETAKEDYAHMIEKHGKIDIILLSAGEDGHIGSLYPNHHTIQDDAEYVVTTKTSPKEPPERLSLSKNLIKQSKVSIILFFGEAKRKAYEQFQKEGSINDCPARIAKQIKESYVLTDIQP